MTKVIPIVILVLVKVLGSSAFWSLDTDLQLGYEIYDRSYEVNAVIQAVVTAASRNNVIQTDNKTKLAVNGLSAIANQLKSSPITFFNEISNFASSRSNSEAWHVTRVRNAYVNFDKALTSLLSLDGPLNSLNDVSNTFVQSAIRISLTQIKVESSKVLVSVEIISRDISRVRVNSSLLLTPELLNEFIDSDAAEQITSSLVTIRSTFAILLAAIRDTGRLIFAHGSVHELLSRSVSRDTTTRNNAFYNFINNYNRVRNNLVSSVASYRQAAGTGIFNFILRVRATFDDAIVRPTFDKVQLPLIEDFAKVIATKVYNQTFFETSFDTMRDSILEDFNTTTSSSIYQGLQLREAILEFQRTSFVRRYSNCLNKLVSEAQQSSNLVTNKYAFCLNERTSGIVVVIPSTSTWLSVIRDNINFILQQLNGCLNGQTSVAGRTAISNCIQFNTNNLAFYSAYLPVTVESNLRPVVQNTPMIFRNCISMIPSGSDDRFNEIYSQCKAEVEATTTNAPTETPTDAPTDAPTDEPTNAPTDAPTDAPSDAPSDAPTDAPTETPTDAPTDAPVDTTTEVVPTEATTDEPTDVPTVVVTIIVPSEEPTDAATDATSDAPIEEPSDASTEAQISELAFYDMLSSDG